MSSSKKYFYNLEDIENFYKFLKLEKSKSVNRIYKNKKQDLMKISEMSILIQRDISKRILIEFLLSNKEIAFSIINNHYYDFNDLVIINDFLTVFIKKLFCYFETYAKRENSINIIGEINENNLDEMSKKIYLENRFVGFSNKKKNKNIIKILKNKGYIGFEAILNEFKSWRNEIFHWTDLAIIGEYMGFFNEQLSVLIVENNGFSLDYCCGVFKIEKMHTILDEIIAVLCILTIFLIEEL